MSNVPKSYPLFSTDSDTEGSCPSASALPSPHNCYLTLTIAHIPLRTKPLSKHIMHSAGAPSLLLASGHREGYCSILRSCLSFAKLHSKKKKGGGNHMVLNPTDLIWWWSGCSLSNCRRAAGGKSALVTFNSEEPSWHHGCVARITAAG